MGSVCLSELNSPRSYKDSLIGKWNGCGGAGLREPCFAEAGYAINWFGKPQVDENVKN